MALTLLTALILGVLTGLGVGGGSLLILYLTAFRGMAPDTARGISLLFFFPAALVSILGNRQKIRGLFPAVFWGILSALCFSLLSRRIPRQLLKKALGVLFLCIGTSQLLGGKKK